jgi:hypothetical protein
VNVQTLTLANERSTVSSEVDDLLLRDLPNGFVNGFDIIWYAGDVGDGAIMSNDHILHVVIPEPTVNKIPEQPGTYNLEFTSKDATSIDITDRTRQFA